MKERQFKLDLQRFARQKNAKRQHFVSAYKAGEEAPKAKGETWLKLAKWISTADDDTDEETDDTGFYDGDGTPETTVVSIKVAYKFEGYHDPEDPAQALIADLKLLVDEGRKVWFKVVSANEKKTWIGRATVTEIVAGGGEATEYETFTCTISYDNIPEETVTP